MKERPDHLTPVEGIPAILEAVNDMPQAESSSPEVVLRMHAQGERETRALLPRLYGMYLDIAKELSRSKHYREEQLNDVVEVLDSLEEGMANADEEGLTELYAQYYKNTEKARMLGTQIRNLEAAATLYYRDSALSIKDALTMPRSTPVAGVDPEKAYSIGLSALTDKSKKKMAELDPSGKPITESTLEREDVGYRSNMHSGYLPQTLLDIVADLAQDIADRKAIGLKKLGEDFASFVKTNLYTYPKRVFDFLFKEYSPFFSALFIDGVLESNSAYKKDLETYNEGLKNTGLNRHNDAIIHMYAEGEISQEVFDSTGVSQEVADAAIAYASKMYEELFGHANNVMVAHGMLPVAHRENYLPHFARRRSLLRRVWGTTEDVHRLPNTIAGLTGEFEPKKPFNQHFLQRKGDLTDWGVLEGARSAVPAALRVIHQLPNIVRLRQFEGALREIEAPTNRAHDNLRTMILFTQEYANAVAGKQNSIDRWFSDHTKPSFMELAQAAKSFRALSLIPFSFASATTEVLPLIQAFAFAPKSASIAAAYYFLGGITGRDPLNRSGVRDASWFLSTQYQGENEVRLSLSEDVVYWGMWLKKNASRLFQEFFWHTQFIEGISEGYDGEAAIQYADEVCYRALYSSEAGNGGPMYRGTVAAAVTQFSAEPVNFLGYVLEKAKQKKLWNKAGAIGSILLYGVLVSALEWLVGRNMGLNPVGAVRDAVNARDEDDSVLDTASNAVMNLLVNLNPTELNITGGSYQSNIGAEDFDLSAVFSDLPVTSGVSQIVSGVSGLTGVFAGLGGLVGLGDGTFKSTDFDKILSGVGAFTLGGNTAAKLITGGRDMARGFATTDSGRIKHSIEATPANIMQTLLYGSYATTEAKEYKAEGSHPLGWNQTEAVNTMMENGLSARDAIQAVKDSAAAAKLQEEGETLRSHGNEAEGIETLKEARAMREGLAQIPELPSWAQKYASNSKAMQRVIAMYKQTGASSILPQKTPDKVSITVGKVEYDVEMDDAQKQEYASAYIKAYRTQVETIKDRTEAGYKKAASRAREIASRYIIKKYHKNGGDLK